MFNRSSGLLMHVTSLPGSHGIGDLGENSREFVKLLHRAGQHLWQVLPLGPVGAGNSPYDSRSSFAGNPLLISLDDLAADGLLSDSDISSPPAFSTSKVEFHRVASWKHRRLRRAHHNFLNGHGAGLQDEYETFVRASSDWLEDYALYEALRKAHGGESWYQWPSDLRLHHREALNTWRSKLSDEVTYHRFVQFVFERQWHSLKEYASQHSVTLMGDVPIYVALDSAEVWGNQDQFLLDDRGQPKVQAGVPPDLFSQTGQLWGNPVYDWDRMATDGYQWWQQRINRLVGLTDIVRIDHFRGFAAGWQVPAGAKNAINGEWVNGPGLDLFYTLEQRIGRIPIVVEDLGVITADVEELRDRLGYPGMKVLQFAFDGDPGNTYLPHNSVPGSMVYTGTHDNDTTKAWYESLREDDKAYVRRYARGSDETIHWDILRLAMSSVSVLACAPVQDVLGLGNDARMNVPGRARGNWTWRLTNFEGLEGAVNDLSELTNLYGRCQAPLSDDRDNA